MTRKTTEFTRSERRRRIRMRRRRKKSGRKRINWGRGGEEGVGCLGIGERRGRLALSFIVKRNRDQLTCAERKKIEMEN